MDSVLKRVFVLLMFCVHECSSAQISNSFYASLPFAIKPANPQALTIKEKIALLDSMHRYPVQYIKEANLLAQQVSQIAESDADYNEKIKYFMSVAYFYCYSSQDDSMDYYSKKIISLSGENSKYQLYKAKAILYRSSMFVDKVQYDSSIKYSFMAMDIFTKYKDSSMLIEAYDALAENYSKLGQIEKSLYYNKFCLDLFPCKWNDAFTYYFLQRIRFFLRAYEVSGNERYADSVETFAGKVFIKTQNRPSYWYGSTYYFLGRLFYMERNYRKALQYSDSSLIAKYCKMDQYYGYNNTKTFQRNLCLVAMGNSKLGKRMLITIDAKDFFWRSRLYKNIYEIEEKRSNWKEAFTYLKKYSLYSDSLKMVESNKLLNEAQRNYTIKEKEAQISALEFKDLKRQKEQARLKTAAIIAALILILIITALIGLYRQVQLKRSSEKQLLVEELYKMEDAIQDVRQLQSEKIIEQRKKIAEDMHDEVSSGLAAFR
ncbi:MAG: hypothetical protein ABUT20_51645, partial [Bacteroidota bacterium]